jgi:hypothetical protein
MLSPEFLSNFKRATEARWSAVQINPSIYGFQFQRGTRWNPGLPENEIDEYELILRLRFPRDLKDFLRVMNGTDLPTVNVFGNSGEPLRQSVGVYSYPKDLAIVRQRIDNVAGERSQLTATLAEQDFQLQPNANLLPFYFTRYIVSTGDSDTRVVLSIEDGSDAIVYGNSLGEYLQREFLQVSL